MVRFRGSEEGSKRSLHDLCRPAEVVFTEEANLDPWSVRLSSWVHWLLSCPRTYEIHTIEYGAGDLMITQRDLEKSHADGVSQTVVL